MAENLVLETSQAIREKNWLKAAQLLKALLSENPNNPVLHHDLGNVCIQLTDFETAKQHFQTALQLRPGHAKAYNNLGICHYKTHDWKRAEICFQKALEFEPHNLEAHFNLALNFSAQSLFVSAKKQYEIVLKIHPEHPVAKFNLGLILIQDEEYEDAIACLKDSPEPEGQYFLGNAYLESGQLDLATTAYEQCLKINPEHHHALHNLAIVFLRNQDQAAAQTTFAKVLSLNPKNITAAFMLRALSENSSEPIPKQAPLAYVKDLFDQYAHYYNEHLKSLDYKTPQAMRSAVSPFLPFTCTRCLDLGCGTGWAGFVFHDAVRDLIGVDLSPNMLAQARQLNIYQSLHETDLISFLEQVTDPFDLLLASEVLIYQGDLSPIMALSHRALKPNGLFCFSIETHSKPLADHWLQKTGRYAHHPHYITALAAEHAFLIQACEPCELRQHGNASLHGLIYVLQKSPPSSSIELI